MTNIDRSIGTLHATAITYDNAKCLTTIVQGTSTGTIAYDDADRRTNVTYPNINSVTYA